MSSRATATWTYLWVSTPMTTRRRLGSRFMLGIAGLHLKTRGTGFATPAGRVDGTVTGPVAIRLL
jgi:hypothetical protein